MNAAYAALFAMLLAVPSARAQNDRPHDHVGHLGASVMPFDTARSVHVFTPTPTGGTQAVLSRDGDPGQITLIREHLQHEATAFSRGDYASPAAIHGSALPGLDALRSGAAHVRVLFESLPDGARLQFTARDAYLVDALHRWFAAQVQDHGADAVLGR